MDAAVLASGGRDSALAALLLDHFYDVTLVTATVALQERDDEALPDGVTADAVASRLAAGASAGETADEVSPGETAAGKSAGGAADEESAGGAADEESAGGAADEESAGESSARASPSAGRADAPDPVEAVRTVASALGFPHETVRLDPDVAAAAVEAMRADGYPRRGIQTVHEHALETVAGGDWPVVADGTRRDDRVPTVDRSAARSLEDRHDVDYVRPLAGFGRRAIDDLADRELELATGPSEAIATGDYETELRALLAAQAGADAVAEIFPEHTQSRVVGRR